MTALPVKPPIPSEQAFLFVQEVQSRLTLVGLEQHEYLETVRAEASRFSPVG